MTQEELIEAYRHVLRRVSLQVKTSVNRVIDQQVQFQGYQSPQHQLHARVREPVHWRVWAQVGWSTYKQPEEELT